MEKCKLGIYDMIKNTESLTTIEMGLYLALIQIWNKNGWVIKPIELNLLIKVSKLRNDLLYKHLDSLVEKDIITYEKSGTHNNRTLIIRDCTKKEQLNETITEKIDTTSIFIDTDLNILNEEPIKKVTFDVNESPKSVHKKLRSLTSKTLDTKWLNFIDYMTNDFAVKYPAHRDATKTKKAIKDFIENNTLMTKEEIDKIINKIKNHYIDYCKQNGDYSKGPVKYIENKLWEIPLKISVVNADLKNKDQYEDISTSKFKINNRN